MIILTDNLQYIFFKLPGVQKFWNHFQTQNKESVISCTIIYLDNLSTDKTQSERPKHFVSQQGSNKKVLMQGLKRKPNKKLIAASK